jgi:hydrogenase maturation protease
MKKTLVIGYGNELRGDDGIGPLVAAAIAARHLPHVSAMAVHQLTPELAELLASAELAVLVDARADSVDEAVHMRRLSPRGATITGHHGNPRALLQLAIDLYGRAPQAWLVTVPGYEFGHVRGLSAQGENMVRAALGQIERLLSEQRR